MVDPAPLLPAHEEHCLETDPAALAAARLELVRSPKRDKFFWSAWGGWGLFWMVMFALIVGGVIFWPYFIVGNGRLIMNAFGEAARASDALFYVALMFSLAAVSVAALILLYLLWRRPSFVPKTAEGILRAFLGGLTSGDIMISYTWSANPTFPAESVRTLARMIPCRWLDVDTLLPGVPLELACIRAASECLFAIIFVSAKYISSEICQKEFAQLNSPTAAGTVRRNIIFIDNEIADALGNAPMCESNPVLSRLRELSSTSLGPHTQHQNGSASGEQRPYIVEIHGDDARTLQSNPAWLLLRTMLSTGTFAWLFRTHTPLVFEKWQATAAMLCGHTGSWMLGVFLLGTWLVPLPFAAAQAWYKSTTAVQVVLPLYVLFFFLACWLVSRMTKGLVGQVADLPWLVPDPACLLVVLHRLGVVPTIAVFPGNLHSINLKELERLGVIKLMPWPYSAGSDLDVPVKVPPGRTYSQLTFVRAEDALVDQASIEAIPKSTFLVLWRPQSFDVCKLSPALRQRWVAETEGTQLDYVSMCTLLLLFALDHQCLRGSMSGLHTSSKAKAAMIR
eukprot:m.18193 g.18193  ORF g.18193 m.18193 type:complete len:565 (+) comp3317_c0_seq1:138-1832(+)